jgi:hypothetical protein
MKNKFFVENSSGNLINVAEEEDRPSSSKADSNGFP